MCFISKSLVITWWFYFKNLLFLDISFISKLMLSKLCMNDYIDKTQIFMISNVSLKVTKNTLCLEINFFLNMLFVQNLIYSKLSQNDNILNPFPYVFEDNFIPCFYKHWIFSRRINPYHFSDIENRTRTFKSSFDNFQYSENPISFYSFFTLLELIFIQIFKINI